jgi:hypothetical protein
MKFVIFNIVTGGALVYLVLAGLPEPEVQQVSGPAQPVAAPLPIAKAETPRPHEAAQPPARPVDPLEAGDAMDARDAMDAVGAPTDPIAAPVSNAVPEEAPPAVARASVPRQDVSLAGNVAKPSEGPMMAPPLMSPSDRSRMLRDLARDMEAKFLGPN